MTTTVRPDQLYSALVERLQVLASDLYMKSVERRAAADDLACDYASDRQAGDEIWACSIEAELYLDVCHRIRDAISPPTPVQPLEEIEF